MQLEKKGLGGHAQWAPDEKVALEVSIGIAIAGGRTMATMKHVGLNVAADPFFTVAYEASPTHRFTIGANRQSIHRICGHRWPDVVA